MTEIAHVVENRGGAPSLERGTLVQRPGVEDRPAGALFLATDTEPPTLFVNVGGSWLAVGATGGGGGSTEGMVPDTQRVDTQAPLTGGGRLNEDLVISLPTALESRQGSAQYATDAQAAAGTLRSRALHPAGFLSALDANGAYRVVRGLGRNAVQGALNEVGNAGGGVVYCPAGLYVLDNLQVPANTTLMGAGMGATVFRAPSDTTQRMATVTGAYARLEGITFDYTPGAHPTVHPTDPTVRPDYQGTVTIFVSAPRVAVTRCEVIYSSLDAISFGLGASRGWATYNYVNRADRGGIIVSGTQSGAASEMVVHGNHVERTYASGILCNGPIHNSVISSNTVANTGGSGDGIAAYSYLNNQLSVVNNVCSSNDNNGTHVGGNHVVVSGNSFQASREHGIIYSNAGTENIAVGCSITGNTVSNCGREGIATRYSTDVAISGNRVQNPGRSGIHVADSFRVAVGSNTVMRPQTGHGVWVFAASDVSVTGNQIHNVLDGDGVRGDPRSGGVSSLRVAVSANTIRACSGFAVRSVPACNTWNVVGNVGASNGGGYSLNGGGSATTANIG